MDDKQECLAYWVRQLGGELPLLQLPMDRPRPAVQTHRGAQYRARYTAQSVEGLRAIGRQAGATLFMVMLAAFDVLLYRYTRQEDLVVGSVLANRTDEALEKLVGFFVNTVALRMQVSGAV